MDTIRGVYVIRNAFRTVRVGQGFIRPRLQEHRRELVDQGALQYTWAEVFNENLLDGIERYLADTLQPTVGIYPDAIPIPVNLPLP